MSAATSDNSTGVSKVEESMPAIEGATPTAAEFGAGRALELLTKLDSVGATSAFGKAVGTDALSRVTESTGGVTQAGRLSAAMVGDCGSAGSAMARAMGTHRAMAAALSVHERAAFAGLDTAKTLARFMAGFDSRLRIADLMAGNHSSLFRMMDEVRATASGVSVMQALAQRPTAMETAARARRDQIDSLVPHQWVGTRSVHGAGVISVPPPEEPVWLPGRARERTRLREALIEIGQGEVVDLLDNAWLQFASGLRGAVSMMGNAAVEALDRVSAALAAGPDALEWARANDLLGPERGQGDHFNARIGYLKSRSRGAAGRRVRALEQAVRQTWREAQVAKHQSRGSVEDLAKHLAFVEMWLLEVLDARQT